jgi:serine/threonine protein phosphatase PrpC
VTRFAWGAASDIGRVRALNEDSALAVEGLFAVADGMGGHRGGDVASQVAVHALRDRAPILTTNDLLQAIHDANETIVAQSTGDPALRGMGTTLCVLALVDAEGQERLAIANVGDSRVYLFTNGELEQMTDDHSLVAALVREGRITPEEAEEHPQRNILTRALGIDTDVLVDAWEVVPVVGDRWVLCSDGLFNEVSEDQIAAVLRRLAAPDDAARELVRLANDAGGRDNITVLVVDIIDDTRHAVIAPSDPVAQRPVDVAGFSSAIDPRATNGVNLRARAPQPMSREPRQRPRFTWRVALFFVALLAIAGVVVGAVVHYGGSDDSKVPSVPTTNVATTITIAPSTSAPATSAPPTSPPPSTAAPTTTVS